MKKNFFTSAITSENLNFLNDAMPSCVCEVLLSLDPTAPPPYVILVRVMFSCDVLFYFVVATVVILLDCLMFFEFMNLMVLKTFECYVCLIFVLCCFCKLPFVM